MYPHISSTNAKVEDGVANKFWDNKIILDFLYVYMLRVETVRFVLLICANCASNWCLYRHTVLYIMIMVYVCPP
jgi:hypothetical protein